MDKAGCDAPGYVDAEWGDLLLVFVVIEIVFYFLAKSSCTSLQIQFSAILYLDEPNIECKNLFWSESVDGPLNQWNGANEHLSDRFCEYKTWGWDLGNVGWFVWRIGSEWYLGKVRWFRTEKYIQSWVWVGGSNQGMLFGSRFCEQKIGYLSLFRFFGLNLSIVTQG